MLSQACSALQPPPPPHSVWTPGSRLIYFFCQFPRAMQNQLPPRRSAAAPLWQALGALRLSCYFF